MPPGTLDRAGRLAAASASGTIAADVQPRWCFDTATRSELVDVPGLVDRRTDQQRVADLGTGQVHGPQYTRAPTRGGRLVCVGLPAGGSIQVPIFDTVLGGRSIIGSIVGTRQDLAEVFALHAAGRTRVISQTRKLDEVNACFDEVLASRVPARLVFEF